MTTQNTHAITGDTYRFQDIIKKVAVAPVWVKSRKAWLVDAVAAEKLTRQTYHICARYLVATPLTLASTHADTNVTSTGYCKRCESYCYGDCQS